MPVLYINRCDTRIAFWECVVFFKCILTIIHSWKFYMNQGSIKKKNSQRISPYSQLCNKQGL